MHDTRYDGDRRRDALASVSIMRTRLYTLNLQKDPRYRMWRSQWMSKPSSLVLNNFHQRVA